MRTTLDLPDDVVKALKIKAATDGKKMKTVVTEALESFLNIPKPVKSVFPPPTLKVGKVLNPELTREEIYETRGDRY